MSSMNLIPLHNYWKEAMQRRDIKPLSELDLTKHKHSDTCYILGSGPSIGVLGPKDWAAVARADSVGFNYWVNHAFVPTIYGTEAAERGLFPTDLIIQLKKRLAFDYADVPVIIKDGSGLANLGSFTPEMRKNFYLSVEFLIAGNHLGDYERSLQNLFYMGFFAPRTIISIIPKRRSSAVYHLCLAIMRGYKKIVLLGVDLNNGEHFYATTEEQRGGEYYPEDPKYGVPVSQILGAVVEIVAKPMGIKVFAGSSMSKMAKVLPVWTQHLEELP